MPVKFNNYPLVSVIVNCYNGENYLSAAIKSILNQTFKNFEIIIIDDASIDNTEEVVKSINDTRIHYLKYEVNRERCLSRNLGIDNAKGKYVCFLDSDDKYVENYLQVLNDEIKKTNYLEALYISDFCIWDGIKTEVVEVPIIQKPIADWLFHFPVSPSRACVHKNILLKYKFREDIVIVEDTVLWVSISNEFPVIQIKHPLIWYRVHEGNSVNEGTKSAFDRFKGMKKFFLEPESSHVSKKVKKEMISDVRFRMAEYYKSKSKHSRALKESIVSILIQPTHYQTKAKLFFILSYFPGFSFVWNKIKKQ